jgi:hypothetical protein
LILVVAQLDIPGERKILAQRMTFEAVIGQDAAQVGIVGEIDPEQVPSLTLPPAGAAEEPDRGRHRLLFIGLELESNPLIEAHAEEVVDNLEAQWPVGVVDATDVAEDPETAFRVATQEFEDTRQRLALDPAAKLASPNVGGDYRAGQRRRKMFG